MGLPRFCVLVPILSRRRTHRARGVLRELVVLRGLRLLLVQPGEVLRRGKRSRGVRGALENAAG